MAIGTKYIVRLLGQLRAPCYDLRSSLDVVSFDDEFNAAWIQTESLTSMLDVLDFFSIDAGRSVRQRVDSLYSVLSTEEYGEFVYDSVRQLKELYPRLPTITSALSAARQRSCRNIPADFFPEELLVSLRHDPIRNILLLLAYHGDWQFLGDPNTESLTCVRQSFQDAWSASSLTSRFLFVRVVRLPQWQSFYKDVMIASSEDGVQEVFDTYSRFLPSPTELIASYPFVFDPLEVALS